MRQRGDKNGGGARQSGMTASIHLELLELSKDFIRGRTRREPVACAHQMPDGQWLVATDCESALAKAIRECSFLLLRPLTAHGASAAALGQHEVFPEVACYARRMDAVSMLLGALSGRQVRQSYVDARLPMYVVSVLLNETVISKN